VALCVGTFLRARLALGTLREGAGRLSEMAYDDLYDDLVARGVAFSPAEVGLAGDATAPGYTVEYAVVAPDELSPDGALRRLPGAWCFGACAASPASMAAAARDGSAAAAAWRVDAVG
jgi:tRNA U34 5-carboxymethylaminomethyl modifying enzyme MnmG/GidA